MPKNKNEAGKFNPFVQNEDDDGKEPDIMEMQDSKKAAGVVSEAEHLGRLAKSGDPKLRENATDRLVLVSEKLEQRVRELEREVAGDKKRIGAIFETVKKLGSKDPADIKGSMEFQSLLEAADEYRPEEEI